MATVFVPPHVHSPSEIHHERAAAGNAKVAAEAVAEMNRALAEGLGEHLLLKAAAGAGKSYVLKQLVAKAVRHQNCARVAVVAFTNNQTTPLATALGEVLGKSKVCLFVANGRSQGLPKEVRRRAEVAESTSDIPAGAQVIVSTTHKLGSFGEASRLLRYLGTGSNGVAPFDVLFVDEAWQLPHHLFDKVERLAPITVGVGDVGQLPPLEIGRNPWRGDQRYNPYRAWPNAYEEDDDTWQRELPAVWRPAAGQLDLWRAFYPEWAETLNCVAESNDRRIALDGLRGDLAAIWKQVATGVPTLLEVEGLPAPEAADIDLPIMGVVEYLLDGLFAKQFALEHVRYDGMGRPTSEIVRSEPRGVHEDPLVAVLATRNQAVDDATSAVDRLLAKHKLGENDLMASTVDSWQGQTNGITVAVHPLSGAAQLDEFNSAFGRLAVTCTRATHGLLMVTRPGLDQLLAEAPARPGTPFGEPGGRQLPRQTHQRILATFARGVLRVA